MMRKLGIWGGPALATMLLVVGVAGLSAGPVLAQDRAVPWLGVMTQSLDDGLREGLDYRGEGVLVSQVVDDSPASRAGIRKGDIIISVSSRGVDSPSGLSRVIRSSRAGQSVSIVVSRDGQRRTLNVRLAERPEDSDMPGMDMDELRDLPRKMDHDMGNMRQWNDENGAPGAMTFRGMGRGRLGIRIEDLNGDLGSYFDVPKGRGALVVEVLEGTPAEKAGLKSGDVITEVGGREVSNSSDLMDALRDREKGTVSITFLRKGARRTVQAELEDAPRAMRLGPGRDMTIIRPHMDSREAPEVRREVRRGGDSADSEELQQLRDEVRHLRQRIRELEGDQSKDRNKDQDNDRDDDDNGNDDGDHN